MNQPIEMSHPIESGVTEIAVPGAGAMDAWLARPSTPGRFPAVIVCMELFGVTAHIRDVTERVARLGYVALAPNFYHRTLPGADLAHDEAGRARGFECLHRLERQDALDDVRAALDWLAARPDAAARTGVLGFSVGGHIAYLAATQCPLAACACFYGGWLDSDDIPLGRPRPTLALTPGIARQGCRVACFVGAHDHVVDAGQVAAIERALAEAGVRHEMVVYPQAGHGFFCDRRDSFHRASRDDAWRRVQALFAEALAG